MSCYSLEEQFSSLKSSSDWDKNESYSTTQCLTSTIEIVILPVTIRPLAQWNLENLVWPLAPPSWESMNHSTAPPSWLPIALMTIVS
jgi:hypothetical protein